MADDPSQLPGVLVVDDDSSVLFLLHTVLRDHGLTVWAAPNGEAAVKAYRAHQESIALVLLDVQMPGLDGPQTLAALQEINPAVRACFVSGHTGRYTESDLLRLGALRVLQKPFRCTELAETLRRLVAPQAAPAR